MVVAGLPEFLRGVDGREVRHFSRYSFGNAISVERHLPDGKRGQKKVSQCFAESTVIYLLRRPVLESRDGNLFISAARDRNITLKILGDGYVNVNEINLLHVASAVLDQFSAGQRHKSG